MNTDCKPNKTKQKNQPNNSKNPKSTLLLLVTPRRAKNWTSLLDCEKREGRSPTSALTPHHRAPCNSRNHGCPGWEHPCQSQNPLLKLSDAGPFRMLTDRGLVLYSLSHASPREPVNFRRREFVTSPNGAIVSLNDSCHLVCADTLPCFWSPVSGNLGAGDNSDSTMTLKVLETV